MLGRVMRKFSDARDLREQRKIRSGKYYGSDERAVSDVLTHLLDEYASVIDDRLEAASVMSAIAGCELTLAHHYYRVSPIPDRSCRAEHLRRGAVLLEEVSRAVRCGGASYTPTAVHYRIDGGYIDGGVELTNSLENLACECEQSWPRVAPQMNHVIDVARLIFPDSPNLETLAQISDYHCNGTGSDLRNTS